MTKNSLMGVKALSMALMVLVSLHSTLAAPAKGAKNAKAAKPEHDSHLAPHEHDLPSIRRTNARAFSPVRTVPVKRGEFQVDLVVIAFPDCIMPKSTDDVRAALTSLKGSRTIADYYKEYSQNIAWPVLDAYPTIYMAPHPSGYYCRWDGESNLIGYKGGGGARAAKLREDALRYVQSKGHPKKKGDFVCYVYCNSLNEDMDVWEKLLRPSYPPKPTPLELKTGKVDKLTKYKPKVPWRDPLWPNSIPQVWYPANGATLVHEIGHVLGAPDYYHASEEHDGVEGAPSLPWSYGPTGPGYCRVIYHAYVPTAAYPKVFTPGEYTLAPRSSKFPFKENDGLLPIGLFVPSAHPNYLFCLEYCHNENDLVGNPSAEGLLVHVINVTMTSPSFGPPDLCYTYRRGDPDHKALGKDAYYMQPGDTFDAKSDPAAILPNLLPAGIAISDVRTDSSKGTCTFKLDFPETKFTKPELDYSLLPQTEIVSVDGLLPTSFHITMNVQYRGEPLLTEYGFCYGLKKDPTDRTGKLFPLYHRDRYDARIIDLKPETMYYVRAYARNANGIRYSRNQKGVKLPKDRPGADEPTLFSKSDHLLSTWYFQKWYFGEKNDIFNSANPLFAMMSIANYYRVMPGAVAGRGGKPMFDMTRVHCNPTDSRPKFRLVEVHALRRATEELLRKSGLSMTDFSDADAEKDEKGKKRKVVSHGTQSSPRGGNASQGAYSGPHGAWVARCASALNIRSAGKVFFPCTTEDDLLKHKDRIREWILNSQPVMVVRQNRAMNDDISQRWPLDIAIIDGLGYYGESDTFHIVFPGGCDRGLKSRPNGYYSLGTLLERTSDAMLMFYRP